MAYYVMGTAGHIDHGKSTLIKLLSGIDPDRLPEEKSRGMSIDLGYAYVKLPSGNIVGIVDVPGHERFLRNMLAGVSGLDIVVLVISVTEGVKRQTIEHTEILNLLSIKGGVVVLNKIDLVDSNELEKRKSEIIEFTRGTFLEGAPVIPMSALSGEGKDALLLSLDRLLATISPRDMNRELRLPVDRIFSKSGFGTIVAGSLLSGTIKRGDKAVLMPAGIECKIRSVQAYNQEVTVAQAGQRVAVNLAGVERKDVRRGYELCPPGFLKPTNLVDGKFTALLDLEHPVRNNLPVRVYIGTGEYLGRVKILEMDEIPAGEEGFVQIVLEEPCVCMRGDHFIVRNRSALYTLGGGTIVDPYPSRHKRGREEVIEVLRKKESTDASEIIMAQFIQEPEIPFTMEVISKKAQIPEEEVKTVLETLGETGKIRYLAPRSVYVLSSDYDRILEGILEALETLEKKEPWKPGWKKEEIFKVSGFPRKEIQERILEVMTEEKLVKYEGGLVASKDHRPRLEQKLEILRNKLMKDLSEKGYAPDFRGDLIKKLGTDEKTFKAVEDFLISTGELKKLTPEFLLLTTSFEKAKELVSSHITTHGGIGPAEARDLLKTSRKYIIPLLEYLDQIRFTRRSGDRRVLV